MIGPAAGALLAETRRRPGRLLLTGLAITVATVFAAGTLLLSDTMRAYLTAGSRETPAATAVVVVPGPDAAGADLVTRAAQVDGVAQAVGVWRDHLTVTGPAGGTSWLMTSDPMQGPLSRLPAPAAGRLPATAAEVAITAATAARTGIAPGATLTVAAADGARRVTVTGIVSPSQESAENALLATPDAVASFGGMLERVDLGARSGVEPAVLAQRVGGELAAAAVVRTGDQQRDREAAQVSASVTAVVGGIGVFAGLAVLAAIVVVASTFRIVLTQRRTQLALLRCVGAGRRKVTRAVLAEAVVTGLVAGMLGAALAVVGGYALVAALSVKDVTLVVGWQGLLGCVLLAVVATVVAAVAPAMAAGRIPPVAALGSAGAGESGAPRSGRRLVVAGVLVVLAAVLAGLGIGVLASSIVATAVVAASGLVAFAAVVAAGPLLVRGLAATVGRGIAALGRGPGRLAVANAADVPRRTAATIAVLALGVGLTSALLVALASVGAAQEQNIARNFPTDVVIGAGRPPAAAALAGRLAADLRVVARADGASVLVDPAPGVPDSVARDIVGAAVAGQPDVLVQYAGDARAELESTLGTARLIGLGLVGMTVLVSIVGVGVTLMLSITERTRETGLLRAVGLSRGGVHAMVAWEAALSGIGAAVLGAAIGALYGLLAVQTLGLGGAVTDVPVPSLVALVLGVVAVAVLAAVVPAVRAGRVAPIQALREA